MQQASPEIRTLLQPDQYAAVDFAQVCRPFGRRIWITMLCRLDQGRVGAVIAVAVFAA
ncbi:MAG: hypothetical protein ACJLUP_09005 [Agrobacterium tumefaciens]|jgi:hypothetical protein